MTFMAEMPAWFLHLYNKRHLKIKYTQMWLYTGFLQVVYTVYSIHSKYKCVVHLGTVLVFRYCTY